VSGVTWLTVTARMRHLSDIAGRRLGALFEKFGKFPGSFHSILPFAPSSSKGSFSFQMPHQTTRALPHSPIRATCPSSHTSLIIRRVLLRTNHEDFHHTAYSILILLPHPSQYPTLKLPQQLFWCSYLAFWLINIYYYPNKCIYN
jgi:hypothetical protein